MAAITHLTLEEFLKLPDTEPASEYVDGQILPKPDPDSWHSFVQGAFFFHLFKYYEITHTGRPGVELTCVFGPPEGEQVLVPDVTFVSNERQTGRNQRAAPDIAVEVLVPEESAGRLAGKIVFYLRHGVRLVWVADPDLRSIMVYAPHQDTRTLRLGDTLDGGDVLPGFSVPVDDIFAQIEEPAS